MAADTRMIQGTAIIGQVTKIVRRDDGVLAGGAGDLAWVQAFHPWFLDGEEGDPPVVDESSKGIIVRSARKPFEVFESSGAFEYRASYVAFGTGKEFALGAMYAGATAQGAVCAAMKFDPGTGGKLTVLRHDKA